MKQLFQEFVLCILLILPPVIKLKKSRKQENIHESDYKKLLMKLKYLSLENTAQKKGVKEELFHTFIFLLIKISCS
jgi:hypothetical protein